MAEMARLLALHFSDLHFGPHSRFAGQDPSEVGKRFFAEISRARASTEPELGELDLVLVTGDLTESAARSEFGQARRFFEALVGELGLERRRFCFVPGNHDVSWAHCRRARINQEIEEFDDAELERRLQVEKMGPWDEFLADFYGPSEAGEPSRRALGRGLFMHDFGELGVSVAALDSCTRETDREHGGFIGEAQAQALMCEWNRAERRSWLKLIAVHHNPVADHEDNLREWVAWLGEAAEAKSLSRAAIEHFASDATGFEGRARLHAIAEDTQVQLVLHGHVHAAGHTPWSWRRGVRGQTQVVGAGSWGLQAHKLPGEQSVMFQLLVLDPEQRELRILRRVWEPRARAQGQVEPGTFVDDPACPRGGIALDVGLPEDFAVASAASDEAQGSREDAEARAERAFVSEYRMRLASRHQIWELGAVHMGARRPATPALDDMYVPLRLGARRELDDESSASGPVKPPGEVITPHRILQRHRNLLIRGPAGSGKTTWMRWSFRRLLERDDALPILIELRELARQWSQPGATGKERNFDWWLEQWVERFVGSGWARALQAALTAKTGPRPILMVDGWDELGDLGREFREQFDGFLAAHPRVLAIATSRPYGEQVPEHDERFESVEVQPLSDDEIATLVRLFFAKVHRSADEVERFMRALGAAEQARSLGRTPLLLVMMLIIGRGRPLPDRRHKLYEFCIEQLLDAHPEKRVLDGVLVASWQWAPDGLDPRMRAVARLALWMHENRDASERGRAAVAQREDLVAQLPEAWSVTQRHGFLAWLVASAGLMVDFSDETLAFAHLGFQEFLAAWQLEVDCEGDVARAELCARLCEDVSWWEALRLWSALVEGRALERLEPVLDALLELGDAGFWLAGAIYADGMGGGAFERWLAALPRASFALGFRPAATAAAAWRVSRQDQRRGAIADVLRGEVEGASWLHWWRLDRWWRQSTLDAYLNWPDKRTPAGVIVRTSEKLDASAEQLAWARVWMISSPLWCGARLPLLALRLWPSRRMWSGTMIQALLELGELELADARAWSWEALRRDPPEADLARITGEFVARATRDSTLERELLLAREQARYAASFEQAHTANSARDRLLPVTLARELDDARRAANALARELANRLAASPGPVSELDVIDTTLGFTGVRAMFAQASDELPLVRLLSKACQLSLANATPDEDFDALAAAFTGDALWPALARHLARASSADDRGLLEGLARDPGQREGVLGLGLRYWVRGDIRLHDGSVHSLDDLGLSLPLLDEVPPELELT